MSTAVDCGHRVYDSRPTSLFEGAPESVAALVAWCERGPRFAHVSRVEVVDEDPLGEGTFRIA